MKTVVVILTFITTLKSIAFECHNLRLDKDFKNGNPVNKAKYKTMQAIPVKNQKLGICYAYSATQLIDAISAKRLLEKGVMPNKSNFSESSPLYSNNN